MGMISLAVNHNSLFIRRHSDAAAFAPDLKLGLWAFRFCHVHCSSRFHWACPVAFESARPSRRCNPPDAGNCPTGRSAQVFRPIEVGVFPLLRRCRGRTKWAIGTSRSERRDTIADQPWAIEKYSTGSHFHHKCRSIRLIPAWIGAITSCPSWLGRLPGIALGSQRLPQVPNASSVMELCSALTIKTRTIAISSRYTALLPILPPPKHEIEGVRIRILLGSIRPPRGRQSRNESERIGTARIALTVCDNNTNRRSRSGNVSTSEERNGGDSDS